MPSIDDSRRAALTSVALTLAGCVGGEPTASPTDGYTATETGKETSDSTPAGTLSLEAIPARDVDDDLTVYPRDLREWIRTATTTDETVRTHAETSTYAPEPPLPAFERAVIKDETQSRSGIYDLAVEGGTRYELLVGAKETTPPDSATVTQVKALPTDRRELALAAIGAESDADARVYPETALGSWVRNSFFGGYFAYDGTTYRGKEVQQTDVEFYAKVVWYVLSGTAVDAASAATTLRLATVPDEVRAVVESLRDDADRPHSTETTVRGETAATVEAFVAANPVILTHDAIYRLAFER